MHFPSTLPVTRLSNTTGSLPVAPTAQPRLAGSGFRGGRANGGSGNGRAGGRGAKFRDSLGGLAEEDGEDVLDIVKGVGTVNGRPLWASLTREEVCIWSAKPKVVLAKAKRTPASLRQHGSNASFLWQDEHNFVVTTTAGHHLFFQLVTAAGRQGPAAYELPASAKSKGKAKATTWSTGAGEAKPLTAISIISTGERGMKVGEGVACSCVARDRLLVAVLDPPTLRIVPLPSADPGSSTPEPQVEIVVFSDWPWLVDSAYVNITDMIHVERDDYVFLSSDGRAYLVRYAPDAALEDKDILFDEKRDSPWRFNGVLFHEGGGVTTAVNTRMRLVSIGNDDGAVHVYHLPNLKRSNENLKLSHTCDLRSSLKTTSTLIQTGPVTCLSWTSDGYSLAVGWSRGFSVWSVFGKLGIWTTQGFEGSGYGEGERGALFEDHFLDGVRKCFWGVGDTELFVLTPPPATPKARAHDEQLFVVPFAKSAVTTLHAPDNTKHAFLQMDDRVLVYRGADQPDMSVINPESDVWQHIKLPSVYISTQHPIRYAVISSDARLIAVAGERGLTHYNAISGRWKLFESEKEEDSFRVVGGMAWWSNVLIAACVENDIFQIRLFSRDRPLMTDSILESVLLDSEPLLISVIDSSLLVYTADNTFHHFLIRQTGPSAASLRLCGSIGFEGVVPDARAVRGMSWLVPRSQQKLGDPADDLNVATVIFLLQGELVLLRPRKAASAEVKYDMQVLADRVEFYWTHLSGIGTLENSLWAYEGSAIRVWLDALTIDRGAAVGRGDSGEPMPVNESLAISLDFYPLAVLMDKGIIVGVNEETVLRKSLDFAVFRIVTTTHLFIHHVLRYHLKRGQGKEAVVFASHFQSLVYFAHALEILLHAVLEDEADARPSSQSSTPVNPNFDTANDEAILPRVVEFLDHFDESLEVVVGCARKTEIARWDMLFDIVGKPRDLFEKCMSAGLLRIAASYLLVLHNLEPLEQSSKDTIRILKAAMAADEWDLCRELVRFLYSIDRSGAILRSALVEAEALPKGYRIPLEDPLSPSAAFKRAMASPGSIHDTPTASRIAPLSLTSPSMPMAMAVAGDDETPKLHRVARPSTVAQETPTRTTASNGAQRKQEQQQNIGLGFSLW